MIHIWLPNSQAGLRVWQATTQTWQTADNWQEVATLASLTSKNKAKTACLYFPSVHLLKLQPELSATQLKALGDSGRKYLFEDISITSVDDLQIKSHATPNQPTHLYALHASDRDTWMQAAQLAGVEIVALLPDYLLLPTLATPRDDALHAAMFYQDHATQLLTFGDTLHTQGMAVSYLPLVLGKLPTIDYIYLSGDIPLTLIEALSNQPNISYQIDERLPAPIADPARHWLNFAVVKRDTRIPPYVKAIAAIMVFAILTALLVDGLRWYHYQQAERQAKVLLQQQYEQWFPNERFNPRLTIQRQLEGKLINEQTTSTNVLTTLSQVQPVLRQYQINARQVNYQTNRLQLQLVASNNDSLNQVINALSAQGIAAKLGSVTPAEGGAVAMVDISL